ncbi:MAG: hypothetical protein N2Z63_07425 [Thiobacillaceae bacterium]|nr:hypothetical protein [Thiobacillaceae bacterium]
MDKRMLFALLWPALPAVAQTALPLMPTLPFPLNLAAAPWPSAGPAWSPVPALGSWGAAIPFGAPVVGGLAHPGLQLGPNWLSHQHLMSMTNPYLGSPVAGNPYLRPSLPLPFTPPAFAPSLPAAGLSGWDGRRAAALPLAYPGGSAPAPFALPFNPHQIGGALPSMGPAPVAPPVDPSAWFRSLAQPSGRTAP